MPKNEPFRIFIRDAVTDEVFETLSSMPDSVQAEVFCPKCRHARRLDKKHALDPLTCEKCGLTFQYVVRKDQSKRS